MVRDLEQRLGGQLAEGDRFGVDSARAAVSERPLVLVCGPAQPASRPPVMAASIVRRLLVIRSFAPCDAVGHRREKLGRAKPVNGRKALS